jgi:hypothetical protein
MKNTFATEAQALNFFGQAIPKLIETYATDDADQVFSRDVYTVGYGRVVRANGRWDPWIAWAFDDRYAYKHVEQALDDIRAAFHQQRDLAPVPGNVSIGVWRSNARCFVIVSTLQGTVEMWHWWLTEELYDQGKQSPAPARNWD